MQHAASNKDMWWYVTVDCLAYWLTSVIIKDNARASPIMLAQNFSGDSKCEVIIGLWVVVVV